MKIGEKEIRTVPIPKYGDHMTMQEFIKACESGFFVDSDGSGQYASESEMAEGPEFEVYPSDVHNGIIRREFTHVVWFNK